ncbi:MAG: hypothetical protein R6V75_03890 [Bacteroidales bacterium]
MKRSFKFNAYRLFLPVLVLLLSACAVQKKTGVKEGINLVYKSSLGSSFTVNSQMKSSVITEQMGESMEVEVSSASQSVYRTLAVHNNGTMKMEKEMKSGEQVTKSPMGDTSTDFTGWIGKKVEFQLQPVGTVSEITGLDQFKPIVSATGETLSTDYVERSIRNEFIKLPEHPVKAGETWSLQDTMEIPIGGGALQQEESITFTVGEKVTLDGLDCIRITAEGTSKMYGEMEQQGMTLEITRQTKTTGVLYFALEKGFFHSMEYTSNAVGEVFIPVASMSIPQKLTTKLSLSTVFD